MGKSESEDSYKEEFSGDESYDSNPGSDEDGDKEDETQEEVDDKETEGELIQQEGQLSQDEIEILRLHLRSIIENQRISRLARVPKKHDVFKVPREHPIFSGASCDLESFLMEMELLHGEYTNTNPAKHRPDFITKLTTYFKEGSAARIWFKMWASSRRKAREILSWETLVEGLRKNYGAYDQPRVRFEEYYELKQNTDVQSYIARKAEAALLTNDLTPATILYGFIRGLKENIRNYVNLQCPTTLEEAQEAAIAFENSVRRQPVGSSNNKSEEPKGNLKNNKRKNADSKKEDNGNMTKRQRQALTELRNLRKGKCFICGQEGHVKENCSADSAMKEKHQQQIRKLKEAINDKGNE